VPEDFEFSIRMSREQARTFLEKLARDDTFRTQFEEDPQAAFEEHGITIPQELIPEHVVAPPKHYLEEALWLIHLDDLESAGMKVPFSPPAPFSAPFGARVMAPFSVPFGPFSEAIYGAIWRAQQPE